MCFSKVSSLICIYMYLVVHCRSQYSKLFSFHSPAQTRGPIQLSSTNCQYQIQWQTEYACEVDMLSTDMCAFNSSTHGIDFDLSPLTKPGQLRKNYLFYLILSGWNWFNLILYELFLKPKLIWHINIKKTIFYTPIMVKELIK